MNKEIKELTVERQWLIDTLCREIITIEKER